MQVRIRAKEISLDAPVAAVLSGLNEIFALKEQKNGTEGFSQQITCCEFYSQLVLARLSFSIAASG